MMSPGRATTSHPSEPCVEVPAYLGAPLTLPDGPNPAVFTARTFTAMRTPFLPLTVTEGADVDFQACLPTWYWYVTEVAPPKLEGGDQATRMAPLAGVALRLVTAPGNETGALGVTGGLGEEDADVPPGPIALTEKV